MTDETAADRVPAKRKLALTEDEHQLIEQYRLKNLATDSFNAGLDKAIELFEAWAYSKDAIVEDRALGDSQIAILTARLLNQRKSRVSPL